MSATDSPAATGIANRAPNWSRWAAETSSENTPGPPTDQAILGIDPGCLARRSGDGWRPPAGRTLGLDRCPEGLQRARRRGREGEGGMNAFDPDGFDRQVEGAVQKRAAAKPNARRRSPQPEARPPAFSDEALALRFAVRHANDLRFVAKWGKWLSWTGTHWRFDDTLAALDKARVICREAAAECNAQGHSQDRNRQRQDRRRRRALGEG